MRNTLNLVETETETDAQQEREYREEAVQRLSRAMSSWYVRKDGKYFSVDRLNVRLSKEDVQRACLQRFKEEFGDLKMDREILKGAFERAIEAKLLERDQTIPVWSGVVACSPGCSDRFIWENGMVNVNTWKDPAYREAIIRKPDYGIADDFFRFFFSREEERERFLDWLSWNLQNEGDKPAWAPLFYSESKGSGKSTMCKLVSKLFGEDNTLVQNNVDMLTSRFNMSVLTRKLVISEEVNLPADSSKGNALKTYITETETVSERKGVDAESVKQFCCFMFTTNHLPLWIEADDRRYYLIEIDHDGHASGERAKEFAELVAALHEFMEDDRKVLALYKALMMRKQSKGFNAKTLNVVEDSTPLMKRVHGASEATRKGRLREILTEEGIHALTDADAIRIIKTELDGNISSTKHLMTEIGWSKDKVKWGGREYSKAIWVEKGYWAENGRLNGPDDFQEALTEHLRKSELDCL